MSPSQLLLLLANGLLLCVILTPVGMSLYRKCYYPMTRAPGREIPKNAQAVLAVGVAIVFIYACSAGGLAFFVRVVAGREAEAVLPAKETLRAGALLGAVAFGAARVWALTQSHSFANSLYFTCVLSFALFLAIGVVDGERWTTVTDQIAKRGVDDLTLLPLCSLYAVIAAALSEIVGRCYDRLVPGGTSIPYSLLREQVGAFESYRRVSGEDAVCVEIENALEQEAEAAGAEGRSFRVRLLSCNAHDRVVRSICNSLVTYQRRAGSNGKAVFRSVCHDSKENRNRMSRSPELNARFLNVVQGVSLLVVGNSTAFFGVRMGGGATRVLSGLRGHRQRAVQDCQSRRDH